MKSRAAQSILEMLAKNGGLDQEDGPASRPIPLAQKMGLQDAFRRYHETSVLNPGDIVREKPGLGIFEKDANVVLMLWRKLDLNSPTDETFVKNFLDKVPVPTLNCLVAYQDDDGGSIIFMPHDVARLEKADVS